MDLQTIDQRIDQRFYNSLDMMTGALNWHYRIASVSAATFWPNFWPLQKLWYFWLKPHIAAHADGVVT